MSRKGINQALIQAWTSTYGKGDVTYGKGDVTSSRK